MKKYIKWPQRFHISNCRSDYMWCQHQSINQTTYFMIVTSISLDWIAKGVALFKNLRFNNKKFNFESRRWTIFEEVWGDVGWEIKRWLNEAIIGRGGLYQVPPLPLSPSTQGDILIFITGDKRGSFIKPRSGNIWQSWTEEKGKEFGFGCWWIGPW